MLKLDQKRELAKGPGNCGLQNESSCSQSVDGRLNHAITVHTAAFLPSTVRVLVSTCHGKVLKGSPSWCHAYS